MLLSLLLFFFLQSQAPAQPGDGQPVSIPVGFTENMLYAHPVTTAGIELNLYTDAGGGLFLFRSTVDRLHLPTTTRKSDGEEFEEVSLPEFQPGKAVPPALTRAGKLLVLPDSKRSGALSDISGMLGQEWCGGRV